MRGTRTRHSAVDEQGSLLDPRFKTLTHLPADTIDHLSQSIQGEMVEILQQRNADDMDSPVVESAATEPPPKREKEASFEEILW